VNRFLERLRDCSGPSSRHTSSERLFDYNSVSDEDFLFFRYCIRSRTNPPTASTTKIPSKMYISTIAFPYRSYSSFTWGSIVYGIRSRANGVILLLPELLSKGLVDFFKYLMCGYNQRITLIVARILTWAVR
jgi:hypothetical protein